LKSRCLKCLHFVHLKLICMSYDQKKRRESNWKFDSWPQIPWKKGLNEIWLGRVIESWKDFFEGYKTLPSHYQNKLDLKMISTSKVLGYQKSQFWDSHLGVLRKINIWKLSPQIDIEYTIGKGVMPPFKGCRLCKICAWGCPY